VTDGEERLVAFLERARTRGYLGPGPVEDHLVHARGFVAVTEAGLGRPPAGAVDLGTGGGVPGLVLAAAWPDAAVTLIEAGERRARDLAEAAAELFGARVVVRHGRAEVFAHERGLREKAEVVTARGFASPAVVAEVATGFLAPGGVLVVSEPPGGEPSRWPEAPLAGLGLGPARLDSAAGATYVRLKKRSAADAQVPRPAHQLAKRPAWGRRVPRGTTGAG
jgi:16S rRNA (guanine527-N7)-methyltransferase